MALSTRNCHTLCFLTFRRDSLTDFCTLQPPIFGVPNTISYLCRTKELFIIYPFWSYVILSFNMFLCQKICISVRSTGNLREMYGICWATSPASETLCGWAFQKSYGICCPIFQMSKDLRILGILHNLHDNNTNKDNTDHADIFLDSSVP